MALTVIDSSPCKVTPLVRDSEGFVDVEVCHRVRDPAVSRPNFVGAFAVMRLAGLPQIGDAWQFGGDNEPWALCHPDMRITVESPQKDGEATIYRVWQKFSTRPLRRCQDTEIGNPLLEPDVVSGSSVTRTEEGVFDRFGDAIASSSHEMFRGPQNEWDAGPDVVNVVQNVAELELPLLSQMKHTLNDATLWDLGPRKVKFTSYTWEELFYGACFRYYKRHLKFDVDFRGFDRVFMDEGTKCLNGRWRTTGCSALTGTGTAGIVNHWQDLNVCGDDPDKCNPTHFIRYKDINGENARVILDGNGRPAETAISLLGGNCPAADTSTGTGTDQTEAYRVTVEKYDESNLLLLGIPTDIGFGGTGTS